MKKYTIKDTEDLTLGEINNYLREELTKTNLVKADIDVDPGLKVKIGMMEIDRIFEENDFCGLYEVNLGFITLHRTSNTIQFSDEEIDYRFNNAFDCILSGIENVLMTFESSNGTLVVNRDGTIHPSSDIEDWLLDIERVDIKELQNYYNLCGFGLCDGGDVMDFAYWCKDQRYHLPSRNWRLDIFHPQHLTITSKIVELVGKSFDWIKRHRNI